MTFDERYNDIPNATIKRLMCKLIATSISDHISIQFKVGFIEGAFFQIQNQQSIDFDIEWVKNRLRKIYNHLKMDTL